MKGVGQNVKLQVLIWPRIPSWDRRNDHSSHSIITHSFQSVVSSTISGIHSHLARWRNGHCRYVHPSSDGSYLCFLLVNATTVMVWGILLPVDQLLSLSCPAENTSLKFLNLPCLTWSLTVVISFALSQAQEFTTNVISMGYPTFTDELLVVVLIVQDTSLEWETGNSALQVSVQKNKQYTPL